MLKHDEVKDLLVRFSLPMKGRLFVDHARSHSPVRKVRSSSGNVVTHYYSRKMERVVSTESHTAEQAGAYLYEFDAHVLEYWPQPGWIDLQYVTEDGKKKRRQHCPDFLVLTDECIYLDEWKQADHLSSLALKHPDRFIKEGNEWRSPLLERHCEPLGICYRIRSTEHIPHQRLANQKFLADFLDPECQESSVEASQALQEWFAESAEVPLNLLVKEAMEVESSFSTDDIYRAISFGRLCIDMDEANVSDSERVMVFRDQSAMRLLRNAKRIDSIPVLSNLTHTIVTGTKIGFDGREFEIMAGMGVFILKDANGVITLSHKDFHSLFAEGKLTIPNHFEEVKEDSTELRTLSPTQMAEIERRLDAVNQAAAGRVTIYSKRTIRRFKRKMHEAGDRILEQHLALVSQTSKKGNRTVQIPEEVVHLIVKVGKDRHNKPGGPSKAGTYIQFVYECQQLGLVPCSSRTFSRRLKVSVKQREGRRRAYQEGGIVWYLKSHEPIHGVRPFEIVHIDTTPLELILIAPWGKESLGTVHLCQAMDAESRVVLAFHLSFEKPSFRTTQMLIRDMVRRHARMPETLVVDQGPENRSKQLERICKFCRTSLRQRPAGEARAGTILERHFGVTHTQFIHLLAGNSKIRHHHRSVTKSVRPENFGTWTLPALHKALDEYFDLIYGRQTHPAHGESPIDHFNRRLIETGTRCHRMIEFNRLFLIETCPAASGDGTRTVDGKRGIKVDYIWYQTDQFRTHSLNGKKVDVRVDPWNPGIVFVLIKNLWIECVSKYNLLLRHLTWVELRYVINDLRARFRAKKLPLTQERIIAQLRVLDPSNFDPRLRTQQSEARQIYEALGTAGVNGAVDPSQSPFTKSFPALSESKRSEAPLLAPLREIHFEELEEGEVESEVVLAEIIDFEGRFDEDFGLI